MRQREALIQSAIGATMSMGMGEEASRSAATQEEWVVLKEPPGERPQREQVGGDRGGEGLKEGQMVRPRKMESFSLQRPALQVCPSPCLVLPVSTPAPPPLPPWDDSWCWIKSTCPPHLFPLLSSGALLREYLKRGGRPGSSPKPSRPATSQEEGGAGPGAERQGCAGGAHGAGWCEAEREPGLRAGCALLGAAAPHRLIGVLCAGGYNCRLPMYTGYQLN
jgi:hypothetical protein